MTRACSVCLSPARAEIDCPEMSRLPSREVAEAFGVSKSAIARHRQHSGVEAEESPAAAGSHVAEARAVVAAVKLLRGADWSAQDAAQAGALTTLAVAVDHDPSNISALRELRITLGDYRAGVFARPDPVAQRELAQLVAELSGPSDLTLYNRVYAAALAAGADVEAAQAAAQEATAPPDFR